ncbi:unnamed protein product, partial [Tilletia controversa]
MSAVPEPGRPRIPAALVEGKHASQHSTGQAAVRSSAPTSTNVSAALGPSKRPTARSLQATSASVTTRAPVSRSICRTSAWRRMSVNRIHPHEQCRSS